MPQFLPAIALLACSVYAGGALYIALVEHPARLACATDAALAQWSQSVRRTPRYAASLFVAAAALAEGRTTRLSGWTRGAAAILAVLPFTTAALLPLQRRLLAGPDETQAHAMLQQWRRRNAGRAALGASAMVLFLIAAFPPAPSH